MLLPSHSNNSTGQVATPLGSYVQIAAGGAHACAITFGNQLRCEASTVLLVLHSSIAARLGQ